MGVSMFQWLHGKARMSQAGTNTDEGSECQQVSDHLESPAFQEDSVDDKLLALQEKKQARRARLLDYCSMVEHNVEAHQARVARRAGQPPDLGAKPPLADLAGPCEICGLFRTRSYTMEETQLKGRSVAGVQVHEATPSSVGSAAP